MNDIFEQARGCINSSMIENDTGNWFDNTGSYVDNNEYYILSPLRSDKHVGSFHINLDSGVWFDHSNDEGGDFIKLISDIMGISLKDAAEEIVKSCGMEVGEHIEGKQAKKKAEKKPKQKPRKVLPEPLYPIPNTETVRGLLNKRVRESWISDKWGMAKKIYQYKNIDSQWLFSVCRFEQENEKGDGEVKKNFIPFYYTNNAEWYSKAHDKFRPYQPFGIEKIKNNDNPVLIVEGEKCGQCEVAGYNVLSWFGGSSKSGQTDWNILRDRKVIIWPDADSQRDKAGELRDIKAQPGMKASYKIKADIPNAVIMDIYKYKNIGNGPDGWDLADCIEEGIDPLEVIEECSPKDNIQVEINSHDMFKKFVKHFYDNNSLEQNSGIYWNYRKDLHYWQTEDKNNIICNMQRWLEDTKLHWIIASKMDVVKFFNQMKSYLSSHSTSYIHDNPFKNSAISPYLHVKNGALKISRTNVEFQDRNKYDEEHFKKLYPITCLDFNFDIKYLEGVDTKKDCPSFDFYIKDMIPHDLKSRLSEKKYQSEVEKTMIMFSQIFAYSLIPIKPNEYFFGLFGNQNTGKSFFIKILKSLVGASFCVERKTADMDSRFVGADLWGKKVFVEPDLKTRKMLPEDFIKSYSGEQEISVEKKHQDTIHGIKTSLALFFVTNYKFTVKGIEGVERRFIIIQYKNKLKKTDRSLLDKIIGKFPKGEESGEYKDKTFDERPALLGLALQGWKIFCNDNFEFTLPDWVKQSKDSWVQSANLIDNFYHSEYLDQNITGHKPRTEVFEDYKAWCIHEGRKPLGRSTFYDEFRKLESVQDVKSTRSFAIGAIDKDREFDIDKEYEDNIPF